MGAAVGSSPGDSIGVCARPLPAAVDHLKPRRLLSFQLALQCPFCSFQLDKGELNAQKSRLPGASHALDADQAERVDSLKASTGVYGAGGETNHVDLRQSVQCCVDSLGRNVIKSLLQLLAWQCRNTAGQLEYDSRFSGRVSRIIGHGEALFCVGEPVYLICPVVQFCSELDDRIVADSH